MAAKDAAAAPRQPTEAEIQQLMVRAETLRQQLGSVETQREYVLELTGEARRSLQTMEHVEKAQEGEEILIPLGAGTFVAGRLAHGGKALTSLGTGVHAELPAAAARERLEARVKSLEEAGTALARDAARLSDELARLNAIAESIYGG